jgi:hypothetical protein
VELWVLASFLEIIVDPFLEIPEEFPSWWIYREFIIRQCTNFVLVQNLYSFVVVLVVSVKDLRSISSSREKDCIDTSRMFLNPFSYIVNLLHLIRNNLYMK